MTSRAWTWRHAVQESDLASTTKLVLYNLSLYMNERGEGCFPGTKQQAKDCTLSERAVCEHLAKAEHACFIIKIRHGYGDERWARHEYKPRFPESEKALTQDQCHDVAENEKALTQGQCKALTQGQCKALTQGQSNYPVKNSIEPHSPLTDEQLSEEFETLQTVWKPFDMPPGDFRDAQQNYFKRRRGGVSAERILHDAKTYIHVRHITRCKTKYLENWLSECVWKPEEKMLGEGEKGKGAAKKQASAEVARLYVVIDAAGVEKAKWWPHEAPGKWRIEVDYPDCQLRLRDATDDEIAKLHSSTGEDHGQDQITA